MPEYKQGDMVLARVRDSDGRRIKWSHPVIVLNKAAEISPDKPISVLVITSKFRRPLQPGEFLMPWSPEGDKTTGLRKECIAKCDWLVKIDYAALTERWGFTPRNILESIAYELAYRAKKKSEDSDYGIA